ncbi:MULTISPECIES: uracil-DNA glycosylase [Psychrobacillus]|jgi:DNA polymerase|uniref:Uracil-DNA glycosylase n=1 Tax=Psychrobacillus faecigallinarum TaxID=2762235 RepID=A0ABR8RE78_9BACI|nr:MULTISPECIES: uracil-DNA glycosylase [Psychrobacillus]MBD7946083.1 uracil-DNA glycosylase [Psychrobacillus faecigallinarum]QEY23029.1 uracil-DNA glycosylase [Psychrobacillus sp. AK 1817]QGM32711.1 uracil-DNA glycosylase [Bacillus sp. N3536]
MDLCIKRIEGYPVEGFVKGKGPRKPTLMLIGEAPGENEAIQGIPFIGRAGEELKKSLASIGLTREDVYMTSAVRSRPFVWREKKERNGEAVRKKYNRPPTQKEIIAHAPILDYEITNISPLLIVTLGNVGLQRLLGREATVSKLHGQLLQKPVQFLQSLNSSEFVWSTETYTIIPTYHPASVFYRPSNRDFLEEDWIKIGEYIKSQIL